MPSRHPGARTQLLQDLVGIRLVVGMQLFHQYSHHTAVVCNYDSNWELSKIVGDQISINQFEKRDRITNKLLAGGGGGGVGASRGVQFLGGAPGSGTTTTQQQRGNVTLSMTIGATHSDRESTSLHQKGLEHLQHYMALSLAAQQQQRIDGKP